MPYAIANLSWLNWRVRLKALSENSPLRFNRCSLHRSSMPSQSPQCKLLLSAKDAPIPSQIQLWLTMTLQSAHNISFYQNKLVFMSKGQGVGRKTWVRMSTEPTSTRSFVYDGPLVK